MSARVLLTGVGGSIGCHVLVHLLHNTDWTVVGIDSFRHKGLTDRVAFMLDKHPEYRSRVTVLTHDLTAPLSDMLMRRIGDVDYIVNVASLSDVHASLVDPVPFVTANVAMQLNVLEFARRVDGLRTFLQVSTDEVYGPTDGASLHPEWSAILPSNPYSASKAAQEAACIAWWRSYGVPLVVVNLMNNFGEMQSPSKFPAIVQRKVRRGEPVDIHVGPDGAPGSRWYIHSRNSADAMLYVLRHVRPWTHDEGGRPERFNIVGDRQIDNLALARMIADEVGQPLDYKLSPAAESRPGHDAHYGLDGGKLAALGWKSPVSLEESMRKCVRWYEKHPEWLDPK